jgi:hypothetical protein
MVLQIAALICAYVRSAIARRLHFGNPLSRSLAVASRLARSSQPALAARPLGGLDAALPAVFELRDQIGEVGRGERGSPFVAHVPARPPLTLVNQTRTAPKPRLAVAKSA